MGVILGEGTVPVILAMETLVEMVVEEVTRFGSGPIHLVVEGMQ